MKRYVFPLWLLFGLAACTPTPDPYTPPDDGFDYFPLEVGAVHEFALDSMLFDTVLGQRVIDTVRLEVRLVLTDTMHDQSGRVWYRYERYERPRGSTIPWQPRLAGAWHNDGTRLIEREAGFDLVLMVFPLSENATWNPTAAIDPSSTVTVRGEPVEVFKGWHGRVEATGQPDTIGTRFWPETARLTLADETNLIERRYARDIYARGTGLVYRRREILDSQNLDPDTPWPDKAQKGFIVEMWRN